MIRRVTLVLLLLGTLLVVPAYAYADPTGGALFQILMPTLAAIWGIWLVLANRIRQRFRKFMQRLRGTDLSEEASE